MAERGLLSSIIERTVKDIRYDLAEHDLYMRVARDADEDETILYFEAKKLSLVFLRRAYKQAVIVKQQFPYYKELASINDAAVIDNAVDLAESEIKQNDAAIDSMIEEWAGTKHALQEGKKYANQLKEMCDECRSAYNTTLTSLPFVATGVAAAIGFECAANGNYGYALIMGGAAVLNFAAGLAGQRKRKKNKNI